MKVQTLYEDDEVLVTKFGHWVTTWHHGPGAWLATPDDVAYDPTA